MSRDRRRKQGLLQLIVDDLYRKLVAIGLGILLWFFIDTRITDSFRRPFPLKAPEENELVARDTELLLIDLPPDRVVVNRFLDGDREIRSVDLSFRGPRFQIDQLKSQTLSLVVPKFRSRDWGNRTDGVPEVEYIEFEADDIQRNLRAFEGVTIEMTPPRVRVECQRIDNFTIPEPRKILDQIHITAVGFDKKDLLLDTAKFMPLDKITIRGSAIGIERLTARETMFRVELKPDPADETRVSGWLDFAGEDLGLRFDPRPLLEMRLTPKRRRVTVTLPVVIDDYSLEPEQRGLYVPDPPTVSVDISVSGALSRKAALEQPGWLEQHMRLEVYLERQLRGTKLPDTIPGMSPRLRLAGLHGPQSYPPGEYRLEETVAVKLVRRK